MTKVGRILIGALCVLFFINIGCRIYTTTTSDQTAKSLSELYKIMVNQKLSKGNAVLFFDEPNVVYFGFSKDADVLTGYVPDGTDYSALEEFTITRPSAICPKGKSCICYVVGEINDKNLTFEEDPKCKSFDDLVIVSTTPFSKVLSFDDRPKMTDTEMNESTQKVKDKQVYIQGGFILLRYSSGIDSGYSGDSSKHKTAYVFKRDNNVNVVVCYESEGCFG